MDGRSRIAEVRIGNGTPFPSDISDDVTYHIEDQIGSSAVRLDIYGTIIDKEEFYPFGESSLRTFTYKRYRYVAKELDAESGLYYYGARYYAGWTCRFISVDPLAGKFAQLSPYNYSENNPINDKDIDGMQKGNSNPTPQGQTSNKEVAPASSTAVKGVVIPTDQIKAAKAHENGTNDQMKHNELMKLYQQNKVEDKLYGPNDTEFWLTQKNYNPEMANFVATKNAAANETGFTKFSIWFGYGSGWAAQFGVGSKTTSKPTIVSEPINFNTLKIAPASGNSNTKGTATPLVNGEFVGGNRQINPMGGNKNCAGCAMAGDATLKGHPSSALNHGVTSVKDVMKHFGATEAKIYSSQAEIIKIMTKLGDGSTAVIFGYRGSSSEGHFFNVTNKNGKIQFLDFQKSGSAIMQSNEFSSYKNFWLINTTGK